MTSQMKRKNFSFIKVLIDNIPTLGIGITRNFLYLLVSQVIYKILAFIAFILIARYLGPGGFGWFSYALSFVVLFTLMTDFGVSDLLIRDVAGEIEEKKRKYIRNIATLKIVFSLIAFTAIISSVLAFEDRKDMLIVIAILSLSMILDSYNTFLKSIFRVFERMEYEAMSILLEGVFKLGLILWAIRALSVNIVFIAQMFLLTSIITLVFTTLAANIRFVPLGLSFDFKFWKRLFINSIPFAILILFHTINFRIDIIMLSKMVTNVVTGWYSVAIRLIEPILVIPVVFTAAVFPVISRLSKTSRKSLSEVYKSSIKVLILCSVFLVIFLYFGARFFVPLLFGPEFIKSIFAVKILSCVLVPVFLRFFLDSFVLALKRPKILLMNYTAGTFINIFLNLIFIPRFSFYGACVATIISEFIMIGFYFLWLKRNLAAVVIEGK